MCPINVSAEKLLQKASKVATLYGFTPINQLFDEYRGVKRKKVSASKSLSDKRLQHISLLVRFALEKQINVQNEPLFVYHTNIDSNIKRVMTSSKKTDGAYFTLSILGIKGPYAEAFLLSCVHHIFLSLRSKGTNIRLNTMGTAKDAKAYFSQLKKTLKKYKSNLSQECIRLLNKEMYVEAHPLIYSEDHLGVYENLIPSLRHVSAAGNSHFEKIIEYLEQLNLTYEFANELVQDPMHGNHTVFEVCSNNTTLHATGGRHDSLAKSLYKTEIPVTSITITIPEQTVGNSTKNRRYPTPNIFLFHAGEKAQLRSLSVFTKLLHLNIPIAQQLHHPKVNDQLCGRRNSYRYIAVFGQEEADNDVVCLRNTETREFDTFKLMVKSDLERIKNFI